jgi:hypothetical protein
MRVPTCYVAISFYLFINSEGLEVIDGATIYLLTEILTILKMNLILTNTACDVDFEYGMITCAF